MKNVDWNFANFFAKNNDNSKTETKANKQKKNLGKWAVTQRKLKVIKKTQKQKQKKNKQNKTTARIYNTKDEEGGIEVEILPNIRVYAGVYIFVDGVAVNPRVTCVKQIVNQEWKQIQNIKKKKNKKW